MSNGVVGVISAEWFKMKRRRSTIIIPLIVTVFAVAVFFGLDLAVRREWLGVPSGFNVAAGSLNVLINVLLLVTVLATCFHISREFALGTIKATLVRPISRTQWYTAKLLSAGATVGALFLLVVAVVLILAALRFGFTDLMEKDYLVHSAGALGWRLILTIALTLWSLWVLVAVMSMLSSLINHPGGAIAAGLGLGLVSMVLAMFPTFQPYLLSTYFSLAVDQMVVMSKGLPLVTSWGQIAKQTLLGGAGWMIGSLLIGYRIVAKKEITF